MRDKVREVEDDVHPTSYVRQWLKSLTVERDERSQRQPDPLLDDAGGEVAAARSHRSLSPRDELHTSRQIANNEVDTTPDIRGGSPPLQGSPGASQKYARRRRHKTKPERYEYKAETSADIRRSTKAKSKRRHSHRADGATLNQDFKAPNVESERLTLKHGSMPGFLAKGKASEAMDRRGLPDLTFSEMAFLGKKRQLDDARFRGIQAMTTKGKDRGGAREISGYFDDLDRDGHEPSGTRSQVGARPASGARSVSDILQQNQLDLPNRSVEVTNALPERRDSLRRATHAYQAPHASQSEPQRSSVPAHPARASTYISWSTSPSRNGAEPPHHTLDLDYPDEMLQHPRDHLSSLQQAMTIYPRSSVSNPTAVRMSRAARRTTLAEQQQDHHTVESRRFYSLDDLKQLAKNTYSRSAQVENVDQPKHAAVSAVRLDHLNGDRAGETTQGMYRVASGADARHDVQKVNQSPTMPHPIFAQADTALMPRPEPASTGTYRFSAIISPGSHSLDETDSAMISPLLEPGLEDVRPMESAWIAPQIPDRYAGPDFTVWDHEGGEHLPGGLDQFDEDLLRSVDPPEEYNGILTHNAELATTEARTSRSSTEHLVPDQDFLACPITSRSCTSQFDSGGDGVLPHRAQLLRPSQQQGEIRPPFASFKRPRLLY